MLVIHQGKFQSLIQIEQLRFDLMRITCLSGEISQAQILMRLKLTYHGNRLAKAH
jgi:hypothetical protein